MGIKLEKKTFTNPIGKPTKCRVVFKGYYRDIPVALTFEAETERDIANLVPLVPERTLVLELRDPNATLTQFLEEDDGALSKLASEAEKMIADEDARKEKETGKGKKGKGGKS